jgi:thiol-disulfide isomerase/thioredoxin
MRNMTADEIAEYIGVKLEATTEDDVFPFNEELLADEFPVLVKFHESWCSRCKHMKSALEYAASKTVGRIMFMEVECSSTVETRKFCGKHHVDGFPTLKLMVCAASTRAHSPPRRAVPLLAPLMLMPPRVTITCTLVRHQPHATRPHAHMASLPGVATHLPGLNIVRSMPTASLEIPDFSCIPPGWLSYWYPLTVAILLSFDSCHSAIL